MEPKQKSFFELIDDYVSEFIPKHLNSSGLYEKMLAQFERSLIGVTLKATDDNQSKTASILGLHRTTLRKKIKELNIKHDAKA
jgi:two-component system nitrogen regulation response regulator GlnG